MQLLGDTSQSGSLLRNLRHDIPASIVVFLVALPLSLGIAIASGAPLMAGLIAAVVGGIVAGAIGGSPLQVTGPAAGLTVVVNGLIDEFGWQMTCVITIAAGVLQLAFGVMRVARLALGVAPVVVHAMLAGIGVTIVLQQIHVLLGGASRSSAWENIAALPDGLLHHELREVTIGGIVIAILLLWPRVPPKVRIIPGALVGIVVATAFAIWTGWPVERINLSGNFFQAISLPSLPGMAPGNESWLDESGELLMGVITVALIASVESLLSAVGVDKMHNGPRTNFNREMLGQGSANIVSGLLGGLPVTGVIVRSSTNVTAGARTRLSAVLHGVWILLFASLLTGLVDLVPKAALAGLLIVIGIQLVKLSHIKLAWRTGNFAIYAVTLVCVVFLNLLEGVAIGLGLAIAMLLVRIARAPIVVRPDGDEQAARWRVEIDGTLSFLLLPRLTKMLSTLPPGAHVKFRLNADYIDDAVSEAVSDWRRAYEASGGVVDIVEKTAEDLSRAQTSKPKRRYGNRKATAPASPNPRAVLLTCADSRVPSAVIAAGAPGAPFTVRNVGNVVPTDPSEGSVDAALDFAINQLGASSVVVCGHSSCGAMTALLTASADGPVTPMRRWLGYAQDSLDAYRGDHPTRVSAAAQGFGGVDQLSLVNVAIQTERLARQSTLADAVASGAVEVVGMFYDDTKGRAYEVGRDGAVRPAQAAGRREVTPAEDAPPAEKTRQSAAQH